MEKVLVIDTEVHITPDDTTDVEFHTPDPKCLCHPEIIDNTDHPGKTVYLHKYMH